MPRSVALPEADPEDWKIKEPGEDAEYDAWFKEQVQIGIDEADRGELIPQDEMSRWFEEQRALLKKIAEQERN